VTDALRLYRHLRAALQTLLLAFVLAMPGVSQAAVNACPHSDRAEMVVKADAPAEDCHDAAKMANADHQDSDQESKGKTPCCDTGMSCAPALALLSSASEPQAFTARSAPVVAPAASFTSHISVPDYPPPRA
jgi:hypothetical protein